MQKILVSLLGSVEEQRTMASDRRKVLVLGACTLDLVAQVDHFPKPDAKVRTTAFTTSGGGNAGNTATA